MVLFAVLRKRIICGQQEREQGRKLNSYSTGTAEGTGKLRSAKLMPTVAEIPLPHNECSVAIASAFQLYQV